MSIVYISLLIIFSLLCIYIAYKIYNNFQKEKKRQYIENNEFEEDNYKKPKGEIYYFYTNWCPHCKDSTPLWDTFYNSPLEKKYNLSFIKIDCENKKYKPLIKDFKVKEYPTIILVVNGKKYVYDANLSEATLNKFLQAVYSNLKN